jgi:hypothetical protein
MENSYEIVHEYSSTHKEIQFSVNNEQIAELALNSGNVNQAFLDYNESRIEIIAGKGTTKNLRGSIQVLKAGIALLEMTVNMFGSKGEFITTWGHKFRFYRNKKEQCLNINRYVDEYTIITISKRSNIGKMVFKINQPQIDDEILSIIAAISFYIHRVNSNNQINYVVTN